MNNNTEKTTVETWSTEPGKERKLLKITEYKTLPGGKFLKVVEYATSLRDSEW
jgi:hypothetical protein